MFLTGLPSLIDVILEVWNRAGEDSAGFRDQGRAAGTAEHAAAALSVDPGVSVRRMGSGGSLSEGQLDAEEVAGCDWRAQPWAREFSTEV